MESLGKRLVRALCIGLLCVTCIASIAATENAPSALVSSLEHETSLPVHDNRFVVDQNIQSLQIIINTDNVSSIKILDPAGKEILPLQNEPGITWQQIDKLYGITLVKPIIGQWEIKGSMQATPKVIIDSNLKMITPDFPNNLFRGETLAISAYLTNNNKRVTTPDLLDQTQFFATLHNVATLEKYKIFLTDDETKSQGLFRFDYELQTLPGVYRITIQAMSLLFQRQQEQQFYLYDYPATYTTKIIGDTDELLVEVTLQSPIVDDPTCRFSALFTSNDGEISSARLAKIADKKWQLFMPVSDATHKLNLLLNAFTVDRRLINITFPDVDVYAMYQQNLTDVKTLWTEKWNLFWQNNQSKQLGYLFGFSKEKFLEELLFLVNQDLPPAAIALRYYPTQLQDLLTTWEPIIFYVPPKTLVDKIKIEQSKEQAKIKAKEKAKEKTAQKVTPAGKAVTKHVVHQERVSPWRKWVIALFVIFIMLFLALLLVIAWMFKPEKVQALHQGIMQSLQAMVVKMSDLKSRLKALKARLPAKDGTPAAKEVAPEVAATPAAVEAAPVTAPEATPAAVEAAPVTAEATPAVEAASVTAPEATLAAVEAAPVTVPEATPAAVEAAPVTTPETIPAAVGEVAPVAAPEAPPAAVEVAPVTMPEATPAVVTAAAPLQEPSPPTTPTEGQQPHV